jgi:branched-chain amino acid transport system substrate-binding protein
MRHLAKVVAVAGCLFAVLVLVACGDDDSSDGGSGDGAASQNTADDGKGPIVIGGALAKTGFMSAFDVPVSQGAELAIADINANGGVLGRDLKIAYSDTKTDQAQGATAAQEVIDKGAAMVIASCDYDFGGPPARVAVEKGLLAFACAASPKFGKQGVGDLAFSISSGTPTEGAMMAEFAYNQLKKRNAYLLEDTGLEYSKAFCQYFRERFEELGGKIAGEDSFANDDASISSQVNNLSDSSADVIAYCSYPPGGAAGLRQIRGAGIDLPIVADTAFDGNYWLDAVPDLSDFYYPTAGSIFGDDPEEKWQEFVSKYKEKTGKDPSNASYPGSGYSIVQGWAAAVEEAGTLDSEKVKAVIEGWQEQELQNGATTYGPEQHMALGRPMAVMEIQNGKNQFVERFAAEKVPQPQY